jgi:hypothetical protein
MVLVDQRIYGKSANLLALLELGCNQRIYGKSANLLALLELGCKENGNPIYAEET